MGLSQMVVSTQYMEPSLARFLISPCQTCPTRDGAVHLLEELVRVEAGIEDAVVLLDQLILGNID
jgi:hypothetical protein